ncbi:hypothetical protein EYF80_052448 [Liparis tanakae]|uniref:Uncharacterized protein n=1 Tax=Liparis tanakae TaxID=230148 RepID=A0A4Z2F920_9TELE|nr:hypothetical protein EYF80_052448 [Liparis tanakae]
MTNLKLCCLQCGRRRSSGHQTPAAAANATNAAAAGQSACTARRSARPSPSTSAPVTNTDALRQICSSVKKRAGGMADGLMNLLGQAPSPRITPLHSAGSRMLVLPSRLSLVVLQVDVLLLMGTGDRPLVPPSGACSSMRSSFYH